MNSFERLSAVLNSNLDGVMRCLPFYSHFNESRPRICLAVEDVAGVSVSL